MWWNEFVQAEIIIMPACPCVMSLISASGLLVLLYVLFIQ